ncbi:hypothetical protein [Microbacterium sp.]|uniref:hypothetical protein n=1 Tax=Microbacterium sp. TaxID=51671 RepID=UPI0039E6BBBB
MWEALGIGIVGTVVGGVATAWIMLLIQSRYDRKRGVARAVEQSRAVDREQVCRALWGHLAEIDHDLHHIRDGDVAHYLDDVRERIAKMRTLARENVSLVGDSCVRAVTVYTDRLLSDFAGIADGRSPSTGVESGAWYLRGVLTGLETGTRTD